jgi:serine/threonine-protein kinase
VPAAALDDPEDALLDDMEAIVPLATRQLRSRGFTVGAEAGTFAVYVKALPEDDASASAARADALAGVEALRTALAGRTGADARVHINTTLHVGAVVLAGGSVKGGALMRLSSWVPECAVDGIAASTEMLEGLDVDSEPIEGAAALRLVAPR